METLHERHLKAGKETQNTVYRRKVCDRICYVHYNLAREIPGAGCSDSLHRCSSLDSKDYEISSIGCLSEGPYARHSILCFPLGKLIRISCPNGYVMTMLYKAPARTCATIPDPIMPIFILAPPL